MSSNFQAYLLEKKKLVFEKIKQIAKNKRSNFELFIGKKAVNTVLFNTQFF